MKPSKWSLRPIKIMFLSNRWIKYKYISTVYIYIAGCFWLHVLVYKKMQIDCASNLISSDMILSKILTLAMILSCIMILAEIWKTRGKSFLKKSVYISKWSNQNTVFNSDNKLCKMFTCLIILMSLLKFLSVKFRIS